MIVEDVIWIPEPEFRRRFGHALVLDEGLGTLVLNRAGQPLYSEFDESTVVNAARQHAPVQVWTEHITGDGALYYSAGLARVNRSGAYLLTQM